jgi:hypothetical protein
LLENDMPPGRFGMQQPDRVCIIVEYQSPVVTEAVAGQTPNFLARSRTEGSRSSGLHLASPPASRAPRRRTKASGRRGPAGVTRPAYPEAANPDFLTSGGFRGFFPETGLALFHPTSCIMGALKRHQYRRGYDASPTRMAPPFALGLV